MEDIIDSPNSRNASINKESSSYKNFKQNSKKPFFSDPSSLEWSLVESSLDIDVDDATLMEPEPLGFFVFRDDLLSPILQPFNGAISTHSLSGIPNTVRTQLAYHLAAESYLATATQLLHSCNLEDSDDASLIIPLKTATTVVPRHIGQVISGLGNIETKMGKVKVRWPTTTIRTAVLNAQRALTMLRRNIINPEDAPQFQPVTNVIFPNREGYAKLQYYCLESMNAKRDILHIGENNNERWFAPPPTFPNMERDLIVNDNVQASVEFAEEYELYHMTYAQFVNRFGTDPINQRDFATLARIGIHIDFTRDAELVRSIRDVNKFYVERYLPIYNALFYMNKCNII